jgi:hypothetical protein
MGKDKYMKLLYVVDVYLKKEKKPLLASKQGKESDSTCFATGLALQPISELALEKVNDDAIVPHAIDLPFLLACNLLGKLLQLLFPIGRHLMRRLIEYTV